VQEGFDGGRGGEGGEVLLRKLLHFHTLSTLIASVNFDLNVNVARAPTKVTRGNRKRLQGNDVCEARSLCKNGCGYARGKKLTVYMTV
jgi:GTPase involved in cell partitioning and DNA repair